MRFALLALLIACGGSPKPAASPPIANTANEPTPPAPPPTIATDVPAPPPTDDQPRAPAMTGDPCEGGQTTSVGAPPVPTGKKPPVPTVSIGTPTAGPELDKAIIRRYIKRNINKIQYCYEKALIAKPGLSGKITADFVINPEGHVDASAASGFDQEVSDCIAGVIKDIEFPKPKGGGKVNVNYPFVFSQAK